MRSASVNAGLAGALRLSPARNKLEWQGGNRWRLAFPHAQSDCRVGSANCKCSHAQWSLLTPHVVIGDGRSDFCMSTRADYVIAKGKGRLANYCRSRGQAHASFANFDEADCAPLRLARKYGNARLALRYGFDPTSRNSAVSFPNTWEKDNLEWLLSSGPTLPQ
jgi:hypothetical protein